MELKHVAAATRELNKARASLEGMTKARLSSDFENYAENWAIYLSPLVRVFLKLKHGSQSGRAKGWFDQVTHQARNDPLLRYLLHARNADEHGIEQTVKEVKPIGFGFGFGFLFHQDKVYPKFQEISRGVTLKTVVDRGVPYDPPREHLGQVLPEKSIACICELGVRYYENVIEQARALI